MSTKFVDDDRFDGLYLNVANTAHGIEPMLDTVFSFLRRKTDFFAGPPGSGEKGTELALQKVNEVLQKHAQIYQTEQQKKKKATSPAAKKTKQDPPKKKDEDVIEMGTDGGFDVAATSTSSSPPVNAAAAATTETPKAVAAVEKTAKTTPTMTTTEPTKDDKDDEKAPIGNGGTVEGKYVWTQLLSEVAITVPLPDNTRGRDLNVVMAKKHLKVGLKQPASSPPTTKWIVDAPLTKPIIIDDSFWTVEDGNRLVINLQKSNDQEWWEAVCDGDPKINVQKIQPESSSLNDLDGQTRQTVEKMMFDQRQKAMGLPSSDEQKKFEMLEKFKKVGLFVDGIVWVFHTNGTGFICASVQTFLHHPISPCLLARPFSKQQHPEMDFSNAKIS